MSQCRSKKGRVFFLCIAMVMGLFLLAGCSGDDGSTGPQGEQGEQGPAGEDGADAAAMAKSESCAICHNGDEQADGMSHQEVYNDYTDTSRFDLVITGVSTTVPDSTLTFTLTKDGVPYAVADLAGDLDQERFIAAVYDSTTRQVTSEFRYDTDTLAPTDLIASPGVYTIATSGDDPATFAPESSSAFVYAYVADGKLDTEGIQLYDDVDNAGLDWGDVGTYTTVANVTACETCHGTPYMKHGYRAPVADTLPDFMACKACHVDTVSGSHPDWQVLADDPERYAYLNGLAEAADAAGDSDHDSIPKNMTTEELTKYAYKRSIMSDVHMSHKMEFAYPQSMRNCATCHAGKLTETLDQDNFVLATCQSCHAVDGLAEIVPHAIPDPDIQPCYTCHIDIGGGIAPPFAEIHTGYDPSVYTASGEKYAEEVVVTIDDEVTYDAIANTFTVNFSAASTLSGVDAADIVPSVYVAAYGYDTKDFIVPAYPGAGFSPNSAYFTITQDGATWSATYDLSGLEEGPNYVESAVRRVEVAVAPELYVGDVQVALRSPSRTFNLEDGVYEDYYSDIVKYDNGCGNCHDEFIIHASYDIPAAGNVTVCRMCHVPVSGSGHLEMQSRSFDSFIHAIHSFQAFDYGSIDFTDPVEKVEYMHHIESTFPNFTILNCEACHTSGIAIVYDVPNQSMSMPGVLSASAQNDTIDRAIGTVPSYVTGPASRACGSCHRTHMINEDDAGELATFNAHTGTFGTLIEDGDGVLDEAIDTIMSQFN